MKVTDQAMCQELLDYDNMINYVEGYGNTVLCDVNTKANCDEKETKFLDKFKEQGTEAQQKELARLQNMDESRIKPDTYQFMVRRMRILKALLKDVAAADGGEKEEL